MQRRLPKQGNEKSNVISIGERRRGITYAVFAMTLYLWPPR